MNSIQKKMLYESIMKSVAITVKSALNEHCEEDINEGKLKNTLMAGAIGLSTLLPHQIKAQNTTLNNNTRTEIVQTQNTVFSSPQLIKDVNIVKTILSNIKETTIEHNYETGEDEEIETKIPFKQIAQNIAEKFPTNETGAIYYSYVINCNDSVDLRGLIKQFMFDYNIHLISTNDNMFTGYYIPGTTGSSPFATKLFFPIFSNTIASQVRMLVKFKDNRMKISVAVPQYNTISFKKGAPNPKPGDCYPMKNTDQKESFSSAFVNSNAVCVSILSDMLDYLNVNYKEYSFTEQDEDW